MEPQRYLLNKRGKGEIGEKLESLLYVRLIKLGDEALEEGRKKAAEQRSRKVPSNADTFSPGGHAGKTTPGKQHRVAAAAKHP